MLGASAGRLREEHSTAGLPALSAQLSSASRTPSSHELHVYWTDRVLFTFLIIKATQAAATHYICFFKPPYVGLKEELLKKNLFRHQIKYACY